MNSELFTSFTVVTLGDKLKKNKHQILIMMLLTIVTLNAICCFRSIKDEIAANNYGMHNQLIYLLLLASFTNEIEYYNSDTL